VPVVIEFILHALQPLRGAPGVGTHIAAPNHDLIGMTHHVSSLSGCVCPDNGLDRKRAEMGKR
jgi:hypothetical protein